MPVEPHELTVVADLCARADTALVVAAGRAGSLAVLDLADPVRAAADLATVQAGTDTPFWVRLPSSDDADAELDEVVDAAGAQVAGVVLDGAIADLGLRIAAWARPARRVVVVVRSRDEGLAAVAAGATGLVASGSEAGGLVGDTESNILLQQLVTVGVPVWVRGGIGLHTAAAAVAGGAAGVVLDSQLALVRGSTLPRATRRAVAAMDGSETRVVGGHRIYTRPDLPAAALAETQPAHEVALRLGPDLAADLLPIGQDGAFAKGLADRFGTVGGVVQAVRAAIASHRDTARRLQPLAPGAGVAADHATRYPIAQGPMTRVSDRAAFASAVADGGGLPFLALALMSGPEVRTLLEETAELLGDRPWGVGILGFVPPEVRDEQLEVVHDVRPPQALIAGGRPSQALPLEEAGISTYLHVPSPGLLDRFVKDGARKFVFEGRECGGHVGPRSSFALWDAQIDRLLQVRDAENLQVLFAGGVHDARSAAMVAAAAAPLADRGAHIGVLMGTAYLFTTEAVSGGAILPTFQQVAVECDRTVLLETSPGHATRCVETDFVRQFAGRKAELEAAGVDVKDRWAELETLNLGRLRMASKGLTRDGATMVELAESEQRRDGMYMIGEVATLRSEVTTVAALHAEVSEGSATLLAGPDAAPRVQVRERVPEPLDIAIIGMDAFLPGARGAEEFWANVVAGSNHITEVSPERWDVERYYDADAFTKDAGRKTPSRWGGFLDRIGFDALAYGIPPASLAAIEPVQLLSLEVAARALADAGYATREFDRDSASVIFAAEAGNDLGSAYGARAFLPQLIGDLPPELDGYLPSLTEDSFPGVLSNVIAGRIANRLDLGGVNYTVDAACASSLTAIDAACKELRSGISDLVIAGGADLHNGLNDYLLFASVHALSPTGQCRTFDASADGIALGEGIAAVVLKRRADAERDGDRIYAVIDAVAGSSDGRHLGLTAPRKEGQQRAVERAWAQARRPGTTLGLVEAHGTGTVVGDRTEMATLTELFLADGAAVGSVVLGSVKSQIGHTKCAAGLAGLIKAARAVHHGVLPPTGNLVEPNGYYDATTNPFRFHDRARPWPDATRRAGISAFGFGGTNFHTVISSPERVDGADRPDHGLVQWPAELFVFRGDTVEAARAVAAGLARTVDAVLASDPAGERHPLRDLAFGCAAAGRGPVQIALVADDLHGLAAKLALAAQGADAREGVFVADPGRALAPAGADGQPAAPVVGFLYPGQGSQRPAMIADLFVAFGWLNDILVTGEEWVDVLFPPAAFTRQQRADQQTAITATDVAQPTLGIGALAITRVLSRLGVAPATAGGHSYGELVALAAAGVFGDADLLALSQARGRAILEAIEATGGDPGTMAAVDIERSELDARLEPWPDLVVANHNSPRQSVLSGPTADVEAAVEALTADGIKAKLLPVACAFHSSVIARAGELLADRLADVPVAIPAFPVWSNTTAAPYPPEPDAIRALLAEQVVSPVRFVDQVEAMYDAGVRVFVEAGPGRVLTQQVGKILGDRAHAAVATDASGEHGLRRLLLAVAELATLGVPVELDALFEGRAEPADLRALPHARPGWVIDGAFVRTADGQPLANSLQPADELPTVTLGGGPTADQELTVIEYLRNVRQQVAAERDVMLRYLGASGPLGSSFEPGPILDVGVAATNGSNGHAAPPAPSVNGASANGAAPTPGRTVLSGTDLLAAVLAIVSERTGYPVDMLDPDLDLEADLSIDSIKRIEIVGELAERVGLPGMDASAVEGGGVDESVVEELAQLKTLRGIVEWIDELARQFPGDAASAPAGVSAGGPVLSGADLMAAVLAIVSERTGYPVDMLDPDLDLEADLSIDSIKRIEIVGELAERVGLPGMDASAVEGGGVDESVVEELAQLKTLRGIVEWIDGLSAATAAPAGSAATAGHPAPDPAGPAVPERAGRYELGIAALGPAVPRDVFGADTVVVIGGPAALAQSVEAELVERGATVVRYPATGPGLRIDASVAEAVAEADAVVDLSTAAVDATGDARSVFAVVQPALLGRARRVMAVCSAGDGDRAGASGVPGLMRAVAREFPDTLVRSVEVDALASAGDQVPLAAALVDELLDPDAPSSVSWVGGQRTTRVVVPTPVGDVDTATAFTDESVVLLTGGARGITARVALALAGIAPGRVVLVGRSSEPAAEDPRTEGAADRTALRRVLLDIGELRAPAAIEAACDRILADREIRATLAGVRAFGATVEYHAVDVRDPALGAVIDDVYERHGRLDAIIHGAGVLDDRFVRDKGADGFDRVFGTKVDGARTILAHARPGTRVVLFGSVSGVFGNRGQCDYAAANDALDSMARSHAGSGVHVVSIDWGPWQGGGMVSPELEREYARRGIGLIDPNDGTFALLAELVRPAGPTQVVVMRGEPAAFAEPPRPSAAVEAPGGVALGD